MLNISVPTTGRFANKVTFSFKIEIGRERHSFRNIFTHMSALYI